MTQPPEARTTATPDKTPEEPVVLLAPLADPPAKPFKTKVIDMGRHIIRGRFESQ